MGGAAEQPNTDLTVVDKYTGDGLMAIFGTPAQSGFDATNSVRAAIEMADRFEGRRQELSNDIGGKLKLSIGLQFGNVVVGDVGSNDRLEFATLGDVVNVASRLETATRELNCRVTIGKATIDQAKEEGDPHISGAIFQIHSHLDRQQYGTYLQRPFLAFVWGL